MVARLGGDNLSWPSLNRYVGDEDMAMVIVWPCLKGLVLHCLMCISMWLGEWELGRSVMSVEVRWTEGLNKSKYEGRPKHNMIQVMGKVWV